MGERALSLPSPRAFFAFLFTSFSLSRLNDFSPLSWEPGTGYHMYKSVPFIEKRPRRSETGIKDGFEEMEHEFLFVTFDPEKKGLPFPVFRYSRKFSVGKRTQKVMFHLLSVRISRKIFVNGGGC